MAKHKIGAFQGCWWCGCLWGIAYIKHINACPKALQCRRNGPERHGEPGIKCLG